MFLPRKSVSCFFFEKPRLPFSADDEQPRLKPDLPAVSFFREGISFAKKIRIKNGRNAVYIKQLRYTDSL